MSALPEPVAFVAEAFAGVEDVCASLAPQEWDLPTDVPGWSVKDNLSHLCGIETWLLGRPRPEPVPDAPHVRNDMGARNEGDVEMRRSWPGEKVLAEFRELARDRLKALAALDAASFEQAAQTPVGPGTIRSLLEIRALDCYYHEQDIRFAVGRPGHETGLVPTMVARRMLSTLGATVARRAESPEGSLVVFDIPDILPRPLALAVTGGRAEVVDPEDRVPDATMHMNGATFLRFCGGRWDARASLADGRVRIEGDEKLAVRIIDSMAVTP